MNRDRALRVVLILVGLLFTAAIYPATMTVWGRDMPSYEGAMGLTVYFALGIFLLTAVRQPSAHRSLILFAAWSSIAHAAIMTAMVLRDPRAHEHLISVVIFGMVGVLLLAVAPRRQSAERLEQA